MNYVLMIMYLTVLISMQDTKKTMITTSFFITIEIKKQKYSMIFGMSFI